MSRSRLLIQRLEGEGLSTIQASLVVPIFQKLRDENAELSQGELDLLHASRIVINRIPRLKQVTDQLLGN